MFIKGAICQALPRHGVDTDIKKIDLFPALIASPSRGLMIMGKREKVMCPPGEEEARKDPDRRVRLLAATREARATQTLIPGRLLCMLFTMRGSSRAGRFMSLTSPRGPSGLQEIKQTTAPHSAIMPGKLHLFPSPSLSFKAGSAISHCACKLPFVSISGTRWGVVEGL